MLELERGLPLLYPDGHKNLEVLKNIATEIRKLEIGEQWRKGNGVPIVGPSGGPDPTGFIAHTQSSEPGPIDEAIGDFDVVDRNLLREACKRVIE